MLQNYKLLHHFVIWNIFFALICIPTAGKMVDVFGTPLSISIFYFPFVYIVSDILTEVYGYAIARRALWYTLATQILAVVIFQLVLAAPPSTVFTAQDSYAAVLGASPQLVAFGMLAVFSGDIANNFILAKMKLHSHGGSPGARFVVSTLAGETVNTAVFYIFGLWGMIPLENVWASVLLASLAKTVVEVIALPLTLRIVAWVKRVEGIDHYDRDTDFNPFKL